MTARELAQRLSQYNPPDRTIDEQRQIAEDIHAAAAELDRLADENDRLREALRVAADNFQFLADTYPGSVAGIWAAEAREKAEGR